MTDNLTIVREVCRAHGRDRTRMMDIVREVQHRCGCVSGQAMEAIAEETGAHRVEVEGMVSFYAFLSERPKGRVVIRLCNDIIDRMNGVERVAAAFSKALGIQFGQTTPDGKITLEYAPCIGMSDQAPAALINDVVITELSSDGAAEIARKLKAGAEPQDLVRRFGDGWRAKRFVILTTGKGGRNRARPALVQSPAAPQDGALARSTQAQGGTDGLAG